MYFLLQYGGKRRILTILQKALKDKGIDDMVEEARKSHRESDAEYMRRD